MRSRCLLTLGTMLAVLQTGQAQAQDAANKYTSAVSADPNAHYAAYSWRHGARGRLGIVVPVIDSDDSGAFVGLPFLFELHNRESTDPVWLAHSFWRARIGAVGGYQARLDDFVIRVGMGLEHESNHATDRDWGGFLSFHNVLLFGSLSWLDTLLEMRGTLGTRLLLLSCTRVHYGCTDDTGSTGAEIYLDVWIRSRMEDESILGAFGGLYGSYANGGEALFAERRFAMRGGGLLRLNEFGVFQLYGEALAGHDVGLDRQQSGLWLGVGIGWAPYM